MVLMGTVVLQTTSFSWVDVEYIGKKGIPVVNLRGFSSIAVAEWAMMMSVISLQVKYLIG